MRIINKQFFTQPADVLAKKLLGKLLCKKINNKVVKFKITETECYKGTGDTACHAHKGKTNRTQIMWQEGGVLYIYLCYGMYNMLNIVSGKEDQPEAVLIRGAGNYNGPGKLTKGIDITRELNGVNLLTSEDIWLEDAKEEPAYIATPRIGIAYASKEDQERLWRFVIKENE